VSALLTSSAGAVPPPLTDSSRPLNSIANVASSVGLGPGPLVLSPPQPVELLAGHSSHASHASHYSGSGSSSVVPYSGTGSTSETPPVQPVLPAPLEPAEPTAPAAPARVAVTVTSLPTLAEIEVDGKFVGSTRSVLQLTVGTHRIVINKAGYAQWIRTLEVTSSGELTVHADLLRATVPAKTAPAKTAPAK
jgi:hypothetical protein